MTKLSFATFLLSAAFITTIVPIGCQKKDADLVSCKHTPLLFQDSTCNLPVSRKWHREYHETLFPVSDTAYSITDTLLPLTIIDNNTITIYGDTFFYQAGTSGIGDLEYKTTKTVGEFSYKYLSDSITFTHWKQVTSNTRKYYKVYYP